MLVFSSREGEEVPQGAPKKETRYSSKKSSMKIAIPNAKFLQLSFVGLP